MAEKKQANSNPFLIHLAQRAGPLEDSKHCADPCLAINMGPARFSMSREGDAALSQCRHSRSTSAITTGDWMVASLKDE